MLKKGSKFGGYIELAACVMLSINVAYSRI